MRDVWIGGKVLRLTILDYGLFHVFAGRTIGICGFLIQTDMGKNILVDTGFPAKYFVDHVRATEEDGMGSFGRVLSLDPSNTPRGQLARMGLSPEDVDLVIMTHTHVDHVGGIADFPHAPMLICAAERALERPLYHDDVRPIEWPDNVDYVLVDKDIDVCDGLRLLMAPGHAPGQMSLLVELPQLGAVLLASDAISRPSEFDEGFSGSWDVAMAIESANRLMALAAERKAFVVYGHGPQQWPELRKAPDFYS